VGSRVAVVALGEVAARHINQCMLKPE
jgi:hypothetical protein